MQKRAALGCFLGERLLPAREGSDGNHMIRPALPSATEPVSHFFRRYQTRSTHDTKYSFLRDLITMATSTTRNSTSPASTTAQGRRSENRQAGQKSNITRVRTGCFTCRKRKKKCDEKRPTCLNCQKTGIICEGYPQQVYWENRAAARRPSEVSIVGTPESRLQHRTAQHAMKEQPQNADLVFIPPAGPPLMDPFQQSLPNGEYDYMHDANLDFMFDQLEEGSLLSSSSGSGQRITSTIAGCETFNLLTPSSQPANFQSNLHTIQRSYIPNELPFLISGVESQLHRRLFCHFTGITTHTLSPSVQGGSPFNIVATPLAMRDANVMNTLLAVAGSHLMKIQGGDNGLNTDLNHERLRLHEEVMIVQTRRFQNFKSSSSAGAICSKQDQEIIFATSLLLTLYDICEGSGSGGWQTHLDMAREVLIKGSSRTGATPLTPTSPISPTASIRSTSPKDSFSTTDINPFLLEFFQYHDAVSNVTTSLPVNKPRFTSSADLSKHEPYMIGVRDGLMDFVFRISSLRAQAELSVHKPDGDVICKAVQLWEELSLWTPRETLSVERKLMSEYYQWALFVWLFSVVYPHGKSDLTVQSAVKRIAAGMCDITPGEGVMSCLLFPLFVIGSAAIDLDDKVAIRKQFHRLRSWSALGNIDIAYRVVEKMWLDYDLGLPGSWDWVKQMESHGISILIS